MPFSISKLLQALLFPISFYVTDPDGGGGDPKPHANNPPADPDSNKTFSYEYVKELREENKALRLRRQEAEAKVTELQTASDNATKTAKETVDAATAKANERIIRAELKASALAAGMVDLDGLKLADLSKVKLADDGSVEGADVLMTELKTAKPYLFGQPNTSSPPATPPSNQTPEAKKATEMTDEEYAIARKNIK